MASTPQRKPLVIRGARQVGKTTVVNQAELDYLNPFDSKLIPIEVKSGGEGRLKSLHLFMEHAPHALALRYCAGERSISTVKTQQEKVYHLLNLPYYLVSQTEQYLGWFQDKIKQ